MSTRRTIQLVVGAVPVVVGIPLLAAGVALGWLRLAVQDDDGWFRATPEPVTSAGVLLVSGSSPPALFDVVVGCNRWAYRVLADVLLMTDDDPPFRFDSGGPEPGPIHEPPAPWDPPAGLVGARTDPSRDLVDARR